MSSFTGKLVFPAENYRLCHPIEFFPRERLIILPFYRKTLAVSTKYLYSPRLSTFSLFLCVVSLVINEYRVPFWDGLAISDVLVDDISYFDDFTSLSGNIYIDDECDILSVGEDPQRCRQNWIFSCTPQPSESLPTQSANIACSKKH